MKTSKTVLVTGANKGIGYEIARQLASAGATVFLGARNETRGREAVERLKAEMPDAKVEFLQLDVSDPGSIDHASEILGSKTRSLDALINNAGILEQSDKTILETSLDLIRSTLDTNTLGPLHLTQKVAGLLAAAADGAHVVNLSSGLGQLHEMENSYPAYSISKTALNAVTLQLASAFKDKKIAVNSVCPGWVKTDMGGQDAHRTVQQGADTPVWLVTEAPMSLTGQFLRDRKSIPW